MKKKCIYVLILILIFTLSLLVACSEPETKHECKDICEICGNCTSDCTDPACANKCLGHNIREVTETKVVLYDGPQVLQSSSVMNVKVEGKPLFVYDTRVNHLRSFTYTPSQDMNQVVIFDFEGQVNVEVEIVGATQLYNVKVRPLANDVKVNVSGNKVSFVLSEYGNFVMEYATTQDGNASDNVLHIFANPIETDPVDPENLPENTIYVGPGVWMASAIPVSKDDTTVYLAGGAVVYGQIRTAEVKNLTICGRGILSGQMFDRTKASEFTLPIELQHCENVTIKDIAILDPAGWAVTLYCCQNVTIDNLKIVTARANGDGISVQSCSNVNVKGGFVRTWDDSLVVKNVDNENTSNITFDGVSVWTDLAQSMEVGYETYGPKMNDITFRNITVLHNFHKAAISIHNADNAVIDGVTYENITIEDAQMLGDNQLDGENDFLIDFTIAFNTEWTKSGAQRGSIKNVTVKNVKVIEMASTIKCRMFGESNTSTIDGVTISDVEIGGQKVADLDGLKLVPGAYTNNINYNSEKSVSGARYIPSYSYNDQGKQPSVTVKANIEQHGLVVPDFALLDNEPTYAGTKIDTSSITFTATMGKGDTAKAEWNIKNAVETENYESTNLIDGQRSTEWMFDAWTGEENEFVALSFVFGKQVQVGNIRILGSKMSDVMRYYSVSVFAKADKDASWKRIQSQSDIALSPLNSNYSDVLIRLSTDGYYGLQLRFFQNDDLTHPKQIVVGEVEFYPPSLTTNKPCVIVAEHEDVYNIENMNDGNPLTYFESKKGVFPAEFAIDMGSDQRVKYINIHLPPLLLWENRTQEIEIQGSMNNISYTSVVAKATYLFDAEQGNMIAIVLDEAVEMRYIKLVFTSNSTGYGAQISELYVYGE